jgi:hypothetical protein
MAVSAKGGREANSNVSKKWCGHLKLFLFHAWSIEGIVSHDFWSISLHGLNGKESVGDKTNQEQ